MAARTTKNTVKPAGSKVRPSSKRLRVTSRTAAILRRLRTKQQKIPKRSSSNDWKANVCNELSTVQFKQAQLSDLIRKSQQQLSRLEFVCGQLINLTRFGSASEHRPEWVQLIRLAAAKFPNEFPASPIE